MHYTTFKHMRETTTKSRKPQQDLDFLSSCNFLAIIPRYWRRHQLSVEIAGNKKLLKNLNDKHLIFLTELKNTFSWLDFRHLLSIADSTNLQSITHVKFIDSRKLHTLLAEYLKSGVDPDSVIFNYSNYALSSIEKKVLSHRIRFIIYPNKLDYCLFLTPFEKLACSFQSMTISNKHIICDYIKTRRKSIALSAYYGYASRQMPLNISQAEIPALKHLSQ